MSDLKHDIAALDRAERGLRATPDLAWRRGTLTKIDFTRSAQFSTIDGVDYDTSVDITRFPSGALHAGHPPVPVLYRVLGRAQFRDMPMADVRYDDAADVTVGGGRKRTVHVSDKNPTYGVTREYLEKDTKKLWEEAHAADPYRVEEITDAVLGEGASNAFAWSKVTVRQLQRMRAPLIAIVLEARGT